MTNSHTPGPWRLDDPIHDSVTTDGHNYHVIEAGDELAADQLGVTGFAIHSYMPLADARLIAAAPALLAAAKLVAADESCRSYTYRFLWAAINKAETGK